MLAIYGDWSAPMYWLYVVLECTYVLAMCVAWIAPICGAYMWCLERTYVLAICGDWNAPMCWLYVVIGAHLCVGYMWY